ncbi:hypothetical protein LG3211_2332 [Lysobacter gummosus]|nr:hypothetical protein LG3211_2332 [Lysobacter gummosus]
MLAHWLPLPIAAEPSAKVTFVCAGLACSAPPDLDRSKITAKKIPSRHLLRLGSRA